MNLVTGATGLLGAHLLASLIKAGKFTRAIRRSKSKMNLVEKTFRRQNLAVDSVEWIEADVTDIFSIQKAMTDVENVYHCAAVVSFNPSSAGYMMNVNVNGTANVVNAAIEYGIKKFCHVSSTAALGRSEENILITEESHWLNSKHNSVYAISKYGAEREVWRGIEEGLNAVIINPCVILGAGDWNTDSSRLLGQVAKGLNFFPAGGNAFVDVLDVVEVMMQLMQKGISKERFLVMSENKSYKEIFRMIAEALGKKPPSIKINTMMASAAWRAEWIRSRVFNKSPLVTREMMHSSSRTYQYSNEKIQKTLGYEFIPVKKCINENCRILLEEKAVNH
jgi:nucleoside-diphosphate-sugar epimerase